MEYNFQHENGRWFTEDNGTSLEIDTPFAGGFTFVPFEGAKIASVAAMPGEYPESMMIPEIRRPHYTEDGTSASFEATGSMPFGVPYKIHREFRLTDHELKTDVSFLLPHAFPLKNLMAGGLKFSGAIKTIAITAVPEGTDEIQCADPVDFAGLSTNTELFKSDVPPLMIRFTYDNGKSLTFELGAEIWRWTNARNIGAGTSAFLVRRDGDSVLFTWSLYAFHGTREVTEPPFGRNWSLAWSIVFGEDEIPADAVEVIRAAEITHDCACSGVADKLLKKEIRRRLADAQEGDVYVLSVPPARMCTNASHMNRPKKSGLAHWELPAMRDFAIWGNRQMQKRGAVLLLAYDKGTK